MHLFTVPPGTNFVDALARGLLRQAGDDPLQLARTIVLLPTRRAARSLQEAFLRASGGRALLLPRMQPLGDFETDELLLEAGAFAGGADAAELPPPIEPLRRRLLLAELVRRRPDVPSPDRALALADALATLLDEAQTAEISFDALHQLVPASMAEHWQVTLEFLQIVTQAWPAILADEGKLDPVARRNMVLDLQAAAWRAAPPDAPVFAAGSTGSVPAVARLLRTIAGLPNGAVLLPGLDLAMDDDAWNQIDETHPQAGLHRLLRDWDVTRDAVRPWPDADPVPPRAALLSRALRPAATTDSWRADAAPGIDAEPAIAGLSRIDCATPEHEAETIALLLRDALQQPDATAMLVTPDRGLARRVAAAMRRWDLTLDDSGGRSLSATPIGAFLRLAADAALERWVPVPFLSLLKHPFAACGMPPSDFRRLVRRVEIDALRGPRPGPGIAGVRVALGETAPAWLAVLESFAARFEELLGAGTASLPELLDAHLDFAEALAATDTDAGEALLWRGDDGEAAASLLTQLTEASSGLTPIEPASYPALLQAILSGASVRPRWGTHPRLAIYGPLEARLQSADLVVLGGLNEGTWPRATPEDPWLSRGMREQLKLALPERRIGQSAHDLWMLAAAPRVVLTRAERVDGAPAVPSRWLQRLEASLAAIGGSVPRDQRWARWADLIDRPASVVPCKRPAPKPPVAVRPRLLSVTEIETWRRDPYAIYARHILKLRALEPIDADPGAADRGQFIHDALDAFVTAHPQNLPADSYEQLLEFGRKEFGPALARPVVWGFWWPRFERIARWFLAAEAERRDSGIHPHRTEVTGQWTLPAPFAPFVLRGRADRIDRTEGGWAIVDYKTGRTPSGPDIALGYAPQLPLEAAMVAAGAFQHVPPGEVTELAFWRLTGLDPAGEQVVIGKEPMAMANDAAEGLRQLIADFDNADTPYLSQPVPSKRPAFSDYVHLARVLEWSFGGGEA